MCAYLIAYKLAGGIARRVNEIDLHHPSRESDFPELWPLLHRIEKQNTQLKEQMTNLLEQEQKFNTITNNMNEGLILLDTDSRILFINRSCKELFNVPTMHYEGKQISLFNRSEQLNETVAMALKGETYSAMLKLPEKAGTVFRQSCSGEWTGKGCGSDCFGCHFQSEGRAVAKGIFCQCIP